VSAAPLTRIPVGVVVERRKAGSAWIDFTWRTTTVLPGAPAAAPWTPLSADGDITRFYAGAAEVSLHRSETAHYRDNLASGAPSLWVSLRPTGAVPPYDLVGVTADPSEGEGITQIGDHLVDAVPMPEAVRSIIEEFVAEHPVEAPFFKRKRDRADPEALARPAPAPREKPR
jgi:hypothetical protein